MEESNPPSINDCLAQLRQCLDPAAAAAIEQLNAAINARVDRLTQAVEGPSPWLEVGRALVRQVEKRPRSQPKPKPKPVPRRVVKEKPAPPPPKAPAPAPACPQPPIVDAELTAAASKLQASERGRAARKRRRKAPPPQKPKQKYATGRKIENKQPSKHDEHELTMPVERVRAVVVRLHEAFPKARGGVLERGDGVEGCRVVLACGDGVLVGYSCEGVRHRRASVTMKAREWERVGTRHRHTHSRRSAAARPGTIAGA